MRHNDICLHSEREGGRHARPAHRLACQAGHGDNRQARPLFCPVVHHPRGHADNGIHPARTPSLGPGRRCGGCVAALHHPVAVGRTARVDPCRHTAHGTHCLGCTVHAPCDNAVGDDIPD